jgi:hypothetical protein
MGWPGRKVLLKVPKDPEHVFDFENLRAFGLTAIFEIRELLRNLAHLIFKFSHLVHNGRRLSVLGLLR